MPIIVPPSLSPDGGAMRVPPGVPTYLRGKMSARVSRVGDVIAHAIGVAHSPPAAVDHVHGARCCTLPSLHIGAGVIPAARCEPRGR
jgi:hypothetical protein